MTNNNTTNSSAATNKLSNYSPLKRKITVYIPSTININQTTDNAQQIKNCETLLSMLCGGYTTITAAGGWVSEVNNELIKETITTVYAYTGAVEKEFDFKIDCVIDFCEYLKIEMQQEAISLEVDNKLYFI